MEQFVILVMLHISIINYTAAAEGKYLADAAATQIFSKHPTVAQLESLIPKGKCKILRLLTIFALRQHTQAAVSIMKEVKFYYKYPLNINTIDNINKGITLHKKRHRLVMIEQSKIGQQLQLLKKAMLCR